MAAAVLVLLTVAMYRIHRSMTGLSLTLAAGRVPIPVLVTQAEAVGRGFRDLDERAREVARQRLNR